MPKTTSEDYRDILKIEFKDMLAKFIDDREFYHIYAIGRACTQSTLVGFDYHYYTIEGEPHKIGKYIDLDEYGRIDFLVDTNTDYGRVTSPDSEEVINRFIREFPITSSIKMSIPSNYS